MLGARAQRQLQMKTDTIQSPKQTKSFCPSCGNEGKVYLTTTKPARALIGCAACDMAQDKSGKWTFYVGGITVTNL